MKSTYLYQACLTLLLLLPGCRAVSVEDNADGLRAEMVGVQIDGVAATSGLEAPLCLFTRKAGTQEQFVLARTYTSLADGGSLQIPLNELTGHDYRFLMVAQPAGGEWLSLQTSSGAPFGPGAAWDDLRLVCTGQTASAEGYSGVTDMSGSQIVAQGRIKLSLTRIAGQVVFDIFRTAGSLSQPQSVVSADVESVIDRVSKIEITYENTTTSLRFDADNRLVPAAYAPAPFTLSIAPAMDKFKVTLPQSDNGLLAYDATLRGSLRIAGACLLPSDNRLHVGLRFTYFDTTPICGNSHAGGHTAECHPEQHVSLSLPAAGSVEGLPVASDCFTVNRAGLHCDRIIDVPVGGVIEAEFGWM